VEVIVDKVVQFRTNMASTDGPSGAGTGAEGSEETQQTAASLAIVTNPQNSHRPCAAGSVIEAAPDTDSKHHCYSQFGGPPGFEKDRIKMP
jgi:hypothetical protein